MSGATLEHFGVPEEFQVTAYADAVDMISTMTDVADAFSKLEIVMRVFDAIRTSIIDIDRTCTTDDLISISSYVLVASKSVGMTVDMNIIDSFLPDSILLRLPGYYHTTLRVALEFIMRNTAVDS